MMQSGGSTYDIIVVGGGPAGLTAGLYASRSRLNTVLIEKGLFGGQISNTDLVENFPGFPEGISGMELGQRLHEQASRFGLESKLAEVTDLELHGNIKTVKTSDGDFTARAVILAGGSSYQKLGVPGESEYTGRGVSYCAVCDAAFFQDRNVAVVGGGDAAITEALHLTKFSPKVAVIHRRDQLRATKILQEKAFNESRISFVWDSVVDSIEGKDFVENLKLRNVKTDQNSELKVDGVFVAIGFKPETDYLQSILSLDETGHVITNEKMETDVPGILAAGDIRHNSGRQAITAAGDGATAAIFAEKYLTNF